MLANHTTGLSVSRDMLENYINLNYKKELDCIAFFNLQKCTHDDVIK